MSDTREDLKRRVDELLSREAYREALALGRRIVDEFHENFKLYYILRNVTFNDEERRRMKDPKGGDASSLFLVGYMFYDGVGGAEMNPEMAFRCFSRAAEMGHVYARYLCGNYLYWGNGTVQNKKRGLQMMKSAAEAGCGAAAHCVGDILKWRQYREATHYFALAITLHYNCRDFLEFLLRLFPNEACIWDQWKPRPMEHLQVITPVKEAMMQALFIFRCVSSPIRLPRYVCYLVLSFVCTRNGWYL